MNDTISRQAAIDAIDVLKRNYPSSCFEDLCKAVDVAIKALSAQPEQTGCEYCHEDVDGYVKPIEKNGHAFVRFGMNGWELELKAKGWHGDVKIQYCPMCGRKLKALKQPEPCEDAVSRAEILRMINCINDHHAITPYKSVGAVTEHLTRIASNPPTVTPKHRTGKWIKKHRHYGGFRSYTGLDAMGEQHTVTVDERAEYDDLYCSECGARSADNFLNFCPNCGADMIESKMDDSTVKT